MIYGKTKRKKAQGTLKICDDRGDGMKKLKKLWKKKIWKEYRIAFYIEIVFLGSSAGGYWIIDSFFVGELEVKIEAGSEGYPVSG